MTEKDSEFTLRVVIVGTPAAKKKMLARLDNAIEEALMLDPPSGLLAFSTDKWREQKFVEP